MPVIRSWHERFKEKGLVVIGNHAPEFDFEKEVANVKKSLVRLNVPYPVVMDNDHANWRAFHNRYWPTKYLIDKKGVVRFKTIGEGNHQTTEKMIKTLLAE
ncbi:MAG: redoxin domain-containing protein [Nitrospinota bacterium]|nr:redoxin domain-containing protein [Nitrospinota bacterium]